MRINTMKNSSAFSHNPLLQTIAQKVYAETRLSAEEGLFLLTTPHLDYVQKLADYVRTRKTKNFVCYTLTLHLYPTNRCDLACPLCSFYAKKEADAWFLSPEKVELIVQEGLRQNISEVHIVGGIHKSCSLDYYTCIFSRIKKLQPSLHIKALTAPEIDFLATLHGMPVEAVIMELKGFGLDSIPGGGAEILVDDIRKHIAPKKIVSSRFLEIHKIAHTLGLHSNITLLFGHIEEHIDIIHHLEQVRALQDETHMIKAFVPIPFQPRNTALLASNTPLKHKDIRQIFAVSRLFLDNISHIKVLWNYTGIDAAKDLLRFGGNDFGSISLGEKVSSSSKEDVTEDFLRQCIIDMGRTPIRRLD